LNENALWLDRFSTLETISLDIINIIKEKRLSEDYIFNLESIVETINESKTYGEEVEIENEPLNITEQVISLLEYYNINVEKHDEEISVNENSFISSSDRIAKLYHKSDIKFSDKFRIESSIKTFEEVNWVLFKEGFIEVSWTPTMD